MQRKVGQGLTFRVFSFLMTGFQESRWWWEVVIMIRKALIVWTSVFIANEHLQTVVGLYVIQVALAIHWWANPYVWPKIYRLEVPTPYSKCICLYPLISDGDGVRCRVPLPP